MQLDAQCTVYEAELEDESGDEDEEADNLVRFYIVAFFMFFFNLYIFF